MPTLVLPTCPGIPAVLPRGKEGKGKVVGGEAEPNLSPVIMFNTDFRIPLPLAWQDFGMCGANISCSHSLLAMGLPPICASAPS